MKKRHTLAAITDDAYKMRNSLLLRYRAALPKLDKKSLIGVAQREGVRLMHLLTHRGTDVYILDETTRMTTGTFEALVAAVAVARHVKNGHDTAIFSSGGNLGVALAAYCRRAGIRAVSFNPLANVSLLDGAMFGDRVRLVAVGNSQRTRDMMLYARKRLRRQLGYDPLVPSMPDRRAAMRLRGFAIAELMSKEGIAFSALAQTISAGFGPLGIYEALSKCTAGGSAIRIPAFLGVQQESNAYMHRRWTRIKPPDESSQLIVPTLFDKNPNKTFGTYPAMASLLKKTRGDIVSVSGREFKRYISASLLKKLRARGISHSKRSGDIIGKSGLMALAGVLKAIDTSLIRTGPVIVCMTDGTQRIARSAKPWFVANKNSDTERILVALANETF